jgi:hypothetical protein
MDNLKIEKKEIWDSVYSRAYRSIRYKKTISDLVLDGVIPEGKIPSRNEMMRKAQEELLRKIGLSGEEDRETMRRRLVESKFSEADELVYKKNSNKFTEYNRSWSTKKSSTLHEDLSRDRSQWEEYHKLYREVRSKWDECPYEVIAKYLFPRRDWVIGDFGCGENLLKNYLDGNKVYSFDHVSIDESVTSCDISNVPLENETLDIAVYSLSLMGTNYIDYLKEGHRTLKPFGKIIICEPLRTEKWENGNGIEDGIMGTLGEIGFNNPQVIKKCSKFIYAIAEK